MQIKPHRLKHFYIINQLKIWPFKSFYEQIFCRETISEFFNTNETFLQYQAEAPISLEHFLFLFRLRFGGTLQKMKNSVYQACLYPSWDLSLSAFERELLPSTDRQLFHLPTERMLLKPRTTVINLLARYGTTTK